MRVELPPETTTQATSDILHALGESAQMGITNTPIEESDEVQGQTRYRKVRAIVG